MAIAPYVLNEIIFNEDRGLTQVDPSTGSSYNDPVLFNKLVPTGSAQRAYVGGNMAVTVIDPNGEGVCKPRLVATASLKVTIINSTSAVPGGTPFTSVATTPQDILDLAAFLGEELSGATIPAPGA